MLHASLDASPLYYDPISGKFTPSKPSGRVDSERNKSHAIRPTPQPRRPKLRVDEKPTQRKLRKTEKRHGTASRRHRRSGARRQAPDPSIEQISEGNSGPLHSSKLSPDSHTRESQSERLQSVSSPFVCTDNLSSPHHIGEVLEKDDLPMDSSALPANGLPSSSSRSRTNTHTNAAGASNEVPEIAYLSPSPSCSNFSHQRDASSSTCFPCIPAILDNIYPFVNLDLPSEVDLRQLPDDPVSVERILVERRRAMNCFISVAAEYKRKGMPENAERVAVVGLRLWASRAKEHSSLVVPILLFLASLWVDASPSEETENAKVAYQMRAMAYLRQFEALDGDRWTKFRDITIADKTSNLHDLVTSLPISVGCNNPDNDITDASPIGSSESLSVLTAELQQERSSKRTAEDRYHKALLSQRQLEDVLIKKDKLIRSLEDEVNRLHAQFIEAGT